MQKYHTHEHTTNPDNIGGYAVAAAVFKAIENRFGMHLPKTGRKNRPEPQRPETPPSGTPDDNEE